MASIGVANQRAALISQTLPAANGCASRFADDLERPAGAIIIMNNDNDDDDIIIIIIIIITIIM